MKPPAPRHEESLEEGITAVLARAARANDADQGAIFADVLNTDLGAIERLTGLRRFNTEDALRISRILAEYEKMALGEQARL